MRHVLTFLAALVAALALAAPAGAQAPQGYDDCGYIDLESQTLTDEPEPGVVIRLYARDMSCPAALRNWKRIRFSSQAPYGPVRAGYRCVTIANNGDGGTFRCTKRSRPRVAFRWTTAA